MRSRTNTLRIETPEGVVFSLLLAGPVSRFLAWMIDWSLIIAASWLSGYLFRLVGLISRDLAGAGSILFYFLLSIGYPIILEWRWRGQTLGKRMLRLRVMDEQGLRLEFSQIVIRNLLRFVDSLPLFYLVGGAACLISSRSRRLGDLAAGSIVVHNPPTIRPDLDQLLLGKYNSLADYPHLEARLRQSAGPEEAALALRALMRRDELSPEARVEVFRRLAEHFKSLVEFPPEVVEDISDEQYVRNVAASLYRGRSARL